VNNKYVNEPLSAIAKIIINERGDCLDIRCDYCPIKGSCLEVENKNDDREKLAREYLSNKLRNAVND
jgi:hypothetical protein